MNDTEAQARIKELEQKIKKIEKSNRTWRRKCQRLRNKHRWTAEEVKPEEHRRVVVKDENGREYRDHEWVGHAWYRFVDCNGWITDVNVTGWRYQ